MRSLLFIPGNQPSMLEKAMGFLPDVFVPDMEDSVPSGEKARARSTVADYLERLANPGPLLVPRVNALDTGMAEDDLAAVVGSRIYGISIGKVRSAADMHELGALLSKLEKKAGVDVGRPHLQAAQLLGALVAVMAAEGLGRTYEDRLCGSCTRGKRQGEGETACQQGANHGIHGYCNTSISRLVDHSQRTMRYSKADPVS